MDPRIHRQTLSDLLRRTARRAPDKLAICCGSTAWSYREFDERCLQLAAVLFRNEVQVGTRVGVLARNSHAFAAIRFAVARLGAVLVPINFMLAPAEIAFILRHAAVQMLCVDTEFAEVAQKAMALDTQVAQLLWMPDEAGSAPVPGLANIAALWTGNEEPPELPFDGRAIAQIIYTSGTESQPKGAVLTHEAVISQYVTCLVDAEVARGDRILHALPLYHCAQLDVFLGPAVYVGATNFITSRPIPERLLQMMERERINSFFSPPTVWIDLLRSPEFERRNLAALTKAYYGASIMPVQILSEMQCRLPHLRFWNLYGQTEMAPVATVLFPEEHAAKAGSAGRPALNVETRVVDEHGVSVPPGVVGEIVHRSPQVISGYYADPERTTAAFKGGWFHSGDLGVFDAEGFLTVVDRKKDMIKSGGENVSSREVEEIIYRLTMVAEVAVIGVPHPRWVEAVVAVVIPRNSEDLRESQVIEHCRAQMAHFKVPKRVVFEKALPKSPSGKILKRELRERYGCLLSDDTRN